jgi:hypothetical protein
MVDDYDDYDYNGIFENECLEKALKEVLNLKEKNYLIQVQIN